jgi:carbonic anhydrase
MVSADEALSRLAEGNRRFASGRDRAHVASARDLQRLAEQRPFAIVLGCSDSRVPVEIVFDQGLGDLFVIRVAGNVVAPSLIASVEFAASRFGTQLVVVLGHTGCGAVMATLEAGNHPDRRSRLNSITDRIQPAIEEIRGAGHTGDDLVEQAVRANVRASAEQLRNGSPFLEDLVAERRLSVVGAEFSLHDGSVEFFDGLPREAP